MKKSKIKLSVMMGAIAFVLAIGILIGTYFMSPSNYIAIDVNPSIEIHTNRLNQVTSINPINDDAKQIMAGYTLSDKKLETVIKDIVDRMILNAYLTPDEDNQILITTDDDNASSMLSEDVDSMISAYLEEKQMTVNLLQQNIEVTTESINEAHENSISAGKMAIIEKLIESDAALTMEDLSLKSIHDLISIALDKNIDLSAFISGDYLIENDENLDALESEALDENDKDAIDEEEIEEQNAIEDVGNEDSDNDANVDESEDSSNKTIKNEADEDNDEAAEVEDEDSDEAAEVEDEDSDEAGDIEDEDSNESTEIEDEDSNESTEIEDEDSNESIEIEDEDSSKSTKVEEENHDEAIEAEEHESNHENKDSDEEHETNHDDNEHDED